MSRLLRGTWRSVINTPAFSPLSLSLFLWLKSDAGTLQTSGGGAASADTDPVGQWLDQSGNGRHVSQAVAGSRPTLKLAIQNGLPVIRFDGIDDTLNAVFALNQPVTFFSVAKRPTAGSGWIRGGSGIYYHSYSFGGTFDIYSGNTLNGSGISAGFHTFLANFNGASSRSSVDGGTVASGDAGANNGTGIDLANTSGFGDPDIGELIIVNRNCTTAEEAAVQTYLKSRWGTP